jgi:hypothetical protein
LEDTCSADNRHADAATTTVDLAVAVLGGGFLDSESVGVGAVSGEGGKGVRRRRRGRGNQLEVGLRVVEVVRVVAVGSSCHHRMGMN